MILGISLSARFFLFLSIPILGQTIWEGKS